MRHVIRYFYLFITRWIRATR